MEIIWTTCSRKSAKVKVGHSGEDIKKKKKKSSWPKGFERIEQWVAEWRASDEEKRAEGQGSCREAQQGAKVGKKNLTKLEK